MDFTVAHRVSKTTSHFTAALTSKRKAQTLYLFVKLETKLLILPISYLSLPLKSISDFKMSQSNSTSGQVPRAIFANGKQDLFAYFEHNFCDFTPVKNTIAKAQDILRKSKNCRTLHKKVLMNKLKYSSRVLTDIPERTLYYIARMEENERPSPTEAHIDHIAIAHLGTEKAYQRRKLEEIKDSISTIQEERQSMEKSNTVPSGYEHVTSKSQKVKNKSTHVNSKHDAGINQAIFKAQDDKLRAYYTSACAICAIIQHIDQKLENHKQTRIEIDSFGRQENILDALGVAKCVDYMKKCGSVINITACSYDEDL